MISNLENEKKNLVIATDNFLPRWDGISRFLIEIIPQLKEKYNITIIAPNYGSYEIENVKIIRIPLSKKRIGDYVSAKIAPRKIKKIINKADLVFSQTIGPIGFLSTYYANKNKVPVASFTHSIEWELVPMATGHKFMRMILYPLMKFLTRYIYSKPNLIITPSENISELLTWQGIQTQKKSVNLGVDCESFKPLNERPQKEINEIENLREELKLKNCFVVGYHGRLAYEKDLITLQRAFTWLKNKHENSKLLIVGDGLKEIKQRLTGKDIILTGSKDDPQKYLNLMNIYVTPSLTETTSLTTLEAMASGLPVISTPVGFIKEYIEDTKNGFLFKQKSSYELYKTMDLLKNNSSLAKTIGNRARKTVLEEFQWKHTAQKIIEYLELLPSKKTKKMSTRKIKKQIKTNQK